MISNSDALLYSMDTFYNCIEAIVYGNGDVLSQMPS